MNVYGDWIARFVIAPRTPSDRASLARVTKLVAGATQRLPNAKTRLAMSAKLAMLPFLESVFTNDESARSALGVPFEAVRQIADGVVVPSAEYVAALVTAFAGRPATVVDRNKRTYHVRPVSTIPHRLWTVVYTRDDGLLTIMGSWHEHLLVADLDELAAFFGEQHAFFNLTASEAEELARDFVDVPPVARLGKLDDITRSLPIMFYDRLAQRLASGNIATDDLLPKNASILASYSGADKSDPETRASALLLRAPWEAVFNRLSGLPVRMPDVIVQCFDSFPAEERRVLLRRMFFRARTPVSVFHVVRMVAHYAAKPVLQRFVARLVLRFLTSHEELSSYLRCVRWFANELFRREECGDWTPATLQLVAWVHAHEVLSRMAVAGYRFREIAEALPLGDSHETEFLADRELIETPAHPNRVRSEQLLLCGLADALAERSESLADSTRDLLELVFRENNPYLPWHASLYFGADIRVDPLASYFNGNRVARLRTLLGNRFTEMDEKTFDHEFLIEVLRKELLRDVEWWPFVAARLQGDTKPEPSICDLFMEIVGSGGVDAELYGQNKAAWCMRLNTVSHVATILGGNARERSITLWKESLALVSQNQLADRQDAMALLQSAADHARSGIDRKARLEQLLTDLEQFVDAPASLVGLAWRISRALRTRLPAIDVDVRLARIILAIRASI